MLKIKFIVALLLISGSLLAVPFSEEWNFPKVKVTGKVKKITFKHNSGGKTVSTYNKKGEMILQEIFDTEGKVKNKTEMKYDDKGRLNYLSYCSQYKIDKPRYTEIAEYNDFGRLTCIKRVQAENGYKSDNFFTEKITYTGGNLKEIKVKYEHKTVAFLFKFSKQGQLLETSRKEDTSAPKYLKTFTYDKKGNIKSSVSWRNGDKRFGKEITYLYDRSGNWIERTTVNYKYEDGYSQKVSSWKDVREISYAY